MTETPVSRAEFDAFVAEVARLRRRRVADDDNLRLLEALANRVGTGTFTAGLGRPGKTTRPLRRGSFRPRLRALTPNRPLTESVG